MSEPTIAEAVAEYSAAFDTVDIDEETLSAAKVRIVDSLICSLAAVHSGEQSIRDVMEFVRGKKGWQEARIFGTGESSGLEYASLANATTIRYLDWNDEYGSWNDVYKDRSVGHPSGCIGALLSASDAFEWSGEEFLRSVILAYEIHCRFADRALFRINGLDHVNYGLISTTAAVANYLGLSSSEIEEAINIALAGHIALGQTRCGELSEWKAIAFGNATKNAFHAVDLARSGIHGPSPIFEGESGLSRKLEHPLTIDTAEFGGRDGDFLIKNSNLKKYPICYHIQDSVDIVFELSHREDITPANIESIVIETSEQKLSRTAREEEKWNPKNRNTADHSLPYCITRSLLDGKMTPQSFTESKIRDPDSRGLMEKIELVENEDETVVTITTKDRRFVGSRDYPRGHFKNPLSESELRDKATEATRGVLEEDRWHDVKNFILSLEDRSSTTPVYDMVLAERSVSPSDR